MTYQKNTMSTYRRLITSSSAMACAVTAGLAFMPVNVQAQEDARAIDEVVVTARKKAESLQDVPVAVTAVGSEQMEAYQLDKLDGIATRIPALSITQGGGGASGQVTLRGVGSPPLSPAFDSAVAFSFDDVVVNSSNLVANSMMDVEQVEVLKGPQSLFFGKSASAGVIAFKTANPGDEYEASSKLSYETEEGAQILQGVVSSPLSDTLGLRVAARHMDVDELFEDQAADVAEKTVGEESTDVRVTLAYEPTDRLSANLKVTNSTYENNQPNYFQRIDCGPNNTADAAVYPALPALLAQVAAGGTEADLLAAIGTDPDITALYSMSISPQDYRCGSSDSQLYYNGPQDSAEAANMPGNNGGKPFADMTTDMVRAKIDYDITDTLALTSVTGMFKLDSDLYLGAAMTTEGGGYTRDTIENETLTQEFRLDSDAGGQLNYQMGVFFENKDVANARYQTAFGAASSIIKFQSDDGQANLIGSGLAGPAAGYMLMPADGSDPATGYTHDYHYNVDSTSETISFFVSADYALSPEMTLAGGLRFTEAEKEGKYRVPYSHAALQTPSGQPASPNHTVDNDTSSPLLKFEDENTSPEVSLTYDVNEDMLVYAAYKTGFKSGGIDVNALPTKGAFANMTSCAAANFQPSDCDVIFDSETSEGFEFGSKSQLLDNMLQLNLVAYQYVYEDLQNQQFIASETVFRTFNASEITTQGIEADFIYLPDVAGLTVTGALGYLQAEYTESFITALGDDFNGLTAANSPEFSGSLGVDYQMPLSNGLQLGLGANASFKSEYFADDSLPKASRYEVDATTLLDLRASVGPEDGSWLVSFVGKNITDEIFGTYSTLRALQLPTGDDRVVRENRGSQFFISLDTQF